MPIITLYGAKGGTGRTTSAATLALGFLQTGKTVTIIDATDGEPWLASWGQKTLSGRIPDDRLTISTINDPCELARAFQDAALDPDQVFIIDTAKHVSAARSIALELANLVIVPFRYFLDAEMAIQLASSQIPRSQHMIGLSLSGQSELSTSVLNWMPVFDTPIMWDDRFDLLGPDVSAIMADALRIAANGYPFHPDISQNFTELATEVQIRLGDNLERWGDTYFPPVLGTLNASLKAA